MEELFASLFSTQWRPGIQCFACQVWGALWQSVLNRLRRLKSSIAGLLHSQEENFWREGKTNFYQAPFSNSLNDLTAYEQAGGVLHIWRSEVSARRVIKLAVELIVAISPFYWCLSAWVNIRHNGAAWYKLYNGDIVTALAVSASGGSSPAYIKKVK